MPRIPLSNVPRRVSPRVTSLSTTSRPPLHPAPQPSSTETQPSLTTSRPLPSQPHPHTSLSQPSPSSSQPPQSSPATSTFEPSHPLGSLGSQPFLEASSPLYSSPSQDNEDVDRNNEESNQPSNISESAPSIDRRILIEIDRSKLIFVPPNPAFESLKQIVHSHYDGPYTSWSKVCDTTLLGWWNAFKRLHKWDENRFQEEAVRSVFNSVGAAHIRRIFTRAKKKEKKPVWMKQDIWDAIVRIWETDENYKHRVTVNKRNRAVGLEKGTPAYHGGSASTSEHKKRLKLKLGVEPSIKDTFIRCYSKKDGSLVPAAAEIVEKFNALLEKATQEAAINGTVVDESLLWIDLTGGVYKGRIFGMGSESRNILQGKMPYGMHDEPPISTHHSVDSLREEMRLGLATELEKIKMAMDNKLAQLEERMNTDFGEKVTNLEDKVEEMHVTVEEVQTQMVENNSKLELALDQMLRNQASFFSDVKDLFKKSS